MLAPARISLADANQARSATSCVLPICGEAIFLPDKGGDVQVIPLANPDQLTGTCLRQKNFSTGKSRKKREKRCLTPFWMKLSGA